jgi:hypothetical protein
MLRSAKARRGVCMGSRWQSSQAVVPRYTCDTRVLASYLHALASFSSGLNVICSRKRLGTAIWLSTRMFSHLALVRARRLLWRSNGQMANSRMVISCVLQQHIPHFRPAPPRTCLRLRQHYARKNLLSYVPSLSQITKPDSDISATQLGSSTVRAMY